MSRNDEFCERCRGFSGSSRLCGECILRDEVAALRAEVERLKTELTMVSVNDVARELSMALAEIERLKADLATTVEQRDAAEGRAEFMTSEAGKLKTRLREVAQRQREACADHSWGGPETWDEMAAWVRATPLVTEEGA